MFWDRGFRGERVFRRSWQESPFQKGDLKYVILDLIRDKPRYGYEIIRALEERSHGFYTPSAGVVYPTLQMLEEMGYVSASERDGKKVYTISEEGLKFLDERKDLADEVKDHMKHHWNPENMGAMGEMLKELREIGRLMGHRLHEDPGSRIAQPLLCPVRQRRTHIGRELPALNAGCEDGQRFGCRSGRSGCRMPR